MVNARRHDLKKTLRCLSPYGSPGLKTKSSLGKLFQLLQQQTLTAHSLQSHSLSGEQNFLETQGWGHQQRVEDTYSCFPNVTAWSLSMGAGDTSHPTGKEGTGPSQALTSFWGVFESHPIEYCKPIPKFTYGGKTIPPSMEQVISWWLFRENRWTIPGLRMDHKTKHFLIAPFQNSVQSWERKIESLYPINKN